MFFLRVARMHEDRLLARKLTEDLMRLRDWMKGLERRIARPVLMQDSSEKEYRKKRKEYTVSLMSLFSGGRCKSFVSHLIGYLLFSFFISRFFRCSINRGLHLLHIPRMEDRKANVVSAASNLFCGNRMEDFF